MDYDTLQAARAVMQIIAWAMCACCAQTGCFYEHWGWLKLVAACKRHWGQEQPARRRNLKPVEKLNPVETSIAGRSVMAELHHCAVAVVHTVDALTIDARVSDTLEHTNCLAKLVKVSESIRH